jgi:integrase
MTIKIREWRKGKRVGFEVDIRFSYPDGKSFRRRVKAPVESKSAAKRWGEAKERELLTQPSPVCLQRQEEERKEVPRLSDFGPRFVENDAEANRQKASSIRAKELILANHLYPALGNRRLDRVTDEDVQGLKRSLSSLAPKTVNNVLAVLGKLLRVAARWKVIPAMPCSIELLRVTLYPPKFYDFDEYERLRQAARALGTRYECALFLGADAGLRGGEIIALRWEDVDFGRRHIAVQQQMWRRVIDTPKSGRGRILPMTEALIEALRRHKRSAQTRWVFTSPAGQPPSYRTLRLWLQRVYAHAGVVGKGGGAHVLRHTFCSHLAMRGAPAKAIQELAGHIHLSTTQRYMHLSPQAREGAIALLDKRPTGEIFGDILETGS